MDQVDLSNLVGVESLTRRFIQIETATSRNPSNPDYSTLDIIIEQPLGPSSEAQVQKQTRLYRKKFAQKKVSSDNQDLNGCGRERGRRNKTKPKAAVSSSGTS